MKNNKIGLIVMLMFALFVAAPSFSAKLIEKDRKIVDGYEFKSQISTELTNQTLSRARNFKENDPVSLTEDEFTPEGEAFHAEEESTDSELLPAEKDEAISASMTEPDAAFPAKRRPK